MNKKLVMMMCFLLMIISAGCSSDDEIEPFDDNPSESIIGTWQLLNYNGGFSGKSVDINFGEITFTFTKDGKVNIINKGEEHFPFPTGSFSYSFVTNDRSIFTGEKETALFIDRGICQYLHFTYSEGILYLSEEMYDGYCYALRKIG